jgi:DNA-binding response OmpR family regulator
MLPRILVVDDDHYTRTLFDRLLGKPPGQPRRRRRRSAAPVRRGDFNLVLMDQRLPADNGIDLLREFRASDRKW